MKIKEKENIWLCVEALIRHPSFVCSDFACKLATKYCIWGTFVPCIVEVLFTCLQGILSAWQRNLCDAPGSTLLHFEDVAKEAIMWLLYAEDEHKLNIPVTVMFLQSGLVNVLLQDQQLAKSLFQDPHPSLQGFAAGLVQECLSSEPPVASQSQLTYTIEVLGQLAHTRKANEECVHSLLYFQ